MSTLVFLHGTDTSSGGKNKTRGGTLTECSDWVTSPRWGRGGSDVGSFLPLSVYTPLSLYCLEDCLWRSLSTATTVCVCVCVCVVCVCVVCVCVCVVCVCVCVCVYGVCVCVCVYGVCVRA